MDPRGITLLEVLIAMFVLAVGILSVFGLFTAGRELEARATIKSDAIAYAGTLSNTIANEWIAGWENWLYRDIGGFARVGSGTANPQTVSLPVLIDPCGLSLDTQPAPAAFLRPPATAWDWSRMTRLNSGTMTSLQPFARLTLPLTNGGVDPMTREGAIASVSDQDSVEYQMPSSATDPPLNAFELGRRKLGSDLVPALFVAPTGNSFAQTRIGAGVPVNRTLLIFHKPPVGLEDDHWPAGYLEFQIQLPAQPGLLEIDLTLIPQDQAVTRRSLRPGNWLLIAERLAAGDAYRYDTQWVKIKSATAKTPEQTSWLIVIDRDFSTTNDTWCYGFERLVHAVQLDPTTLP